MKSKTASDDRQLIYKELEPLMTAIKAEFNQIREEMATKQELGRVLEIVQSIDAQLKEWHSIPSNVKRLNADVFELKLKVK